MAFALAACGTTSTTRLDVRVADKTSFSFTDLRKADDKLSSVEPGPRATVTILGDDAISPKPADLVRSWLQGEAAAKLEGKQIQLTRFRVEISDPGGKIDDAGLAASSVVNPIGALLALPLIGTIESANAPKTVYVNIAIAVDGAEIYDISVDVFKGRVSESNINEVIRRTLVSLTRKATQ
jgi:hypothetical protein